MTEDTIDLQALLGSPLFHRTTRRIRLSETGETFYDECLEIVSRIDDLENRVGAHSQTVSGNLRISSTVDVGMTHLAPALSDLRWPIPACVSICRTRSETTDVERPSERAASAKLPVSATRKKACMLANRSLRDSYPNLSDEQYDIFPIFGRNYRD